MNIGRLLLRLSLTPEQKARAIAILEEHVVQAECDVDAAVDSDHRDSIREGRENIRNYTAAIVALGGKHVRA